MFPMDTTGVTLMSLNERRGADRFPIEQEVRYRVLNKKYSHEAGTGQTVNMSSAGVLFATEKLLTPGRKVEISVAWPAQLDGRCALKFVARGKIIRYDQGRAAMEIEQYEFRTAGVKQG